jgi:putative oxidoreductase
MRSVAYLGRLVLGGYLATHGAQKLFGAFGGHGIEGTAAGFEHMGLTPGKPMAALAGAAEFGGGLLTATGIADPLGPIAIAGSMAVATTVHRKNGPLMANGGYELPLTYLAFAAMLAAADIEAGHLGPRLPPRLTAVAAIGAVGLTAFALMKVVRAQQAAAPVEPAEEVTAAAATSA